MFSPVVEFGSYWSEFTRSIQLLHAEGLYMHMCIHADRQTDRQRQSMEVGTALAIIFLGTIQLLFF